MKELYFNTVQEFNDFYGFETMHPQVSQRLGFEYPQHFVRFFKSHSGVTPSEYRKSL